MKEILLGIVASMFFAVTFVLNRAMELSGGSWIWSASLRFFFMLPFLFLIVLFRRNVREVFSDIKKHPLPWLVWSFCGFVLFYAPITYAAASGPGWLVASTWQFTIVAGVLLTPLFVTKQGETIVRQKLPLRALIISSVIFVGIVIIQAQHISSLSLHHIVVGVFPVLVAAFAYPLGNRKMMALCSSRLDTFQRVFGMTLMSLPFWAILSIYGFVTVGPPASNQWLQTFIVAISSGVIATTLFFIATDRVRKQETKLAAVEATQSTQVLFVILGEVWLLASPWPSGLAVIGLALIIAGMMAHSFFSKSVPQMKRKAAS